MPNNDRPILALDFDGVIHRYSRGWQDGAIYDNMTDGFVEWALQAMKHFKLVVYSSRSKQPSGTDAMANWFKGQMHPWHCTDYVRSADECYLRFLDAWNADVLVFHFAHEKPPAFLTIDDRAVQFRGRWNDIKLNPDRLRNYRPWTEEDNNG